MLNRSVVLWLLSQHAAHTLRICTVVHKAWYDTYCIHLNTLRRNLLPQTHKPFTKNIWLPLNEPGIIGNVSLCTDWIKTNKQWWRGSPIRRAPLIGGGVFFPNFGRKKVVIQVYWTAKETQMFVQIQFNHITTKNSFTITVQRVKTKFGQNVLWTFVCSNCTAPGTVFILYYTRLQ